MKIDVVASPPPHVEIVLGQQNKPRIVGRYFVASNNIIQTLHQGVQRKCQTRVTPIGNPRRSIRSNHDVAGVEVAVFKRHWKVQRCGVGTHVFNIAYPTTSPIQLISCYAPDAQKGFIFDNRCKRARHRRRAAIFEHVHERRRIAASTVGLKLRVGQQYRPEVSLTLGIIVEHNVVQQPPGAARQNPSACRVHRQQFDDRRRPPTAQRGKQGRLDIKSGSSLFQVEPSLRRIQLPDRRPSPSLDQRRHYWCVWFGLAQLPRGPRHAITLRVAHPPRPIITRASADVAISRPAPRAITANAPINCPFEVAAEPSGR